MWIRLNINGGSKMYCFNKEEINSLIEQNIKDSLALYNKISQAAAETTFNKDVILEIFKNNSFSIYTYLTDYAVKYEYLRGADLTTNNIGGGSSK